MTRCSILRIQTLTLVLALAAAMTHSVECSALDRIRDRNGTSSGKITKMSALSVTLTKGGVATKKPVEEIISITFDDEPDDLAPARRAAESGRYQDALEKLAKIDRADVERSEVQQEIDFFTTYCKVHQALSGQGSLDDARQQAAGFLSRNSKSYRVPEAIELLGDVMLASEDYEGARTQYGKLGKAPSPYFKARSAVLTGRSLQAEGKHQEAFSSFDNALQAAEGNAIAQSQVLEATLYRAVSQAALGEVDAAAEAVKKMIGQADASDSQLLAQAYNALGDCYLQASNKKAALLAYLHVDLLFSSATADHAKALSQLSSLWKELGKPTRAEDAKQRLRTSYPGSRWATKI